MNTVSLLLHLCKLGVPRWRIDLAARAVVSKVVLKLPADMPALDLLSCGLGVELPKTKLDKVWGFVYYWGMKVPQNEGWAKVAPLAKQALKELVALKELPHAGSANRNNPTSRNSTTEMILGGISALPTVHRIYLGKSSRYFDESRTDVLFRNQTKWLVER